MFATERDLFGRKNPKQKKEKIQLVENVQPDFIDALDERRRILDWVAGANSVTRAQKAKEKTENFDSQIEKDFQTRMKIFQNSPEDIALRTYQETGMDYEETINLLTHRRAELITLGAHPELVRVYTTAVDSAEELLKIDNYEDREKTLMQNKDRSLNDNKKIVTMGINDERYVCYYRLLDNINDGEIVRKVGTEYSIFGFGTEQWTESAIMFRYTTPGDGLYGQYEEISKRVAEESLTSARRRINNQLEVARKLARSIHAYQMESDGEMTFLKLERVANALEHIECRIVAYLQDICKSEDYSPQDLVTLGFSRRIIKSVGILSNREESSVDIIKQDGNAWNVRYVSLALDIERMMSTKNAEYETKIAMMKRQLMLLAS